MAERRPPWTARAAQVPSSLYMDVRFLAFPTGTYPLPGRDSAWQYFSIDNHYHYH